MNNNSAILHFRLASENDAAALLSIYTPYVEKTAITFEYDVPSLEEFQSRIRNTLLRYPYLVAEKEGKILGYAYAGAFHPRAAYEHTVELSMYLAPESRHQGIGKILLKMLLDILTLQNVYNFDSCIAYLDHEDKYLPMDSFYFHETLHFRLVGKFEKCGWKFGRWYDMIWMEKCLDHPEKPAPFLPFPEIQDKAEEILNTSN